MSSRSEPYKGAQLVDSVVGDIRTTDGRVITAAVTLHTGYASSGYKTGFSHVPIRWVTLRGACYRCWRFTGKRFDKAQSVYDKLAGELRGLIVEYQSKAAATA